MPDIFYCDHCHQESDDLIGIPELSKDGPGGIYWACHDCSKQLYREGKTKRKMVNIPNRFVRRFINKPLY
jgi:hypothetical protein